MMVLLKFGKSANWWRIFGLLTNKWAFSIQIEIIYLATFGMIFLVVVLKDINDQRSNFVEKGDLSPYKIFLWKGGRSFQTWEDENNWLASKTLFRGVILLKTATNSWNNATSFPGPFSWLGGGAGKGSGNEVGNNGYFPLKVTWHVTWAVRSTGFALKCSGR